MVHMTGIVGFVHAYYVLDLRHAEGWIGYGTRIHDARFSALATPGAPLELEGGATRVRRLRGQLFVRYRFAFRQGEVVVYEGDQSAAWTKVDGASSAA
jgi:3-hydroxymyristoyl/3-hydroxydecanoyl-(acyl carrier protein) dehydratase